MVSLSGQLYRFVQTFVGIRLGSETPLGPPTVLLFALRLFFGESLLVCLLADCIPTITNVASLVKKLPLFSDIFLLSHKCLCSTEFGACL